MFNPSRNYLRELDIIRFISFFVVFIYHALMRIPPPTPGISAAREAVWLGTFIVQRAGAK